MKLVVPSGAASFFIVYFVSYYVHVSENGKMRIYLTLTICVSLLLLGCGGAQVQRGSFEALVPDAYTGPTFAMDDDSSAWKVNVSIRNPNDKHLHLKEIWNDTINGFEYTLDPVAGDVYYDFKIFPVAASIDYFGKKTFLLGGIGFGLDPFPYVRVTAGINERYFELGAFASLGLAKVSYSVYAPYIDDQGNMAGAGTSSKGVIECDDCSEWKYNGNFGFYVNAFPFSEFALSYSFSAFCPWLYNELQEYPLTFDFPYIFSNYFGGTYIINNHYLVSLGANIHFGNDFKETIWNLELKTAFIF